VAQSLIEALTHAVEIAEAKRPGTWDDLLQYRALLATPPAQPTPTDGWLQDGGLLYRLTDDGSPQNRDEINVTMADGSRSPEARARRAGELLDRIRAGSQAQPAAPTFTTVAAKKLAHLQAAGYQVNGYSIERVEDDGSVKRGAVTAGGMVLWWPGQPVTRQCQWEQIDNEHMPDTWQGACGAVWTFTDGGPKDNDQTYCPKCGGVCIEVAATPGKRGAA
jgi:hypothetical protein